MSDQPQPPKTPIPVTHSHHEGGHPHDHDHGHDHDHEKGHPSEAADSGSDAGTRALSDALKSSFWILKGIMAALVVVFLFSNLRIVGPEERGVILRFGRPVGEGEGILLMPGPKLAWPYPIDEFIKVPISRVQQVESTVGWYRTSAVTEATGDDESNSGPLNPLSDGYTLTGDTNIVHIRASFNYRITDPARYLFAFTNTPVLLTNALNNAITYAAARFKVEYLLRDGSLAFSDEVRGRVSALVQQQGLGVSVEAVIATIIPPRQVKQLFDQVLEATERKNKEVNEASTVAIRTRQEAENIAARIVFSAHNEYTNELVQIRNETNRFGALLPSYLESPALLRQRLLSEMMLKAAPSIERKYVLKDRSDGGKQELRLLLNREESLEPAKKDTDTNPAADNN